MRSWGHNPSLKSLWFSAMTHQRFSSLPMMHLSHTLSKTLLMKYTLVSYILQLWKSQPPIVLCCRICFQCFQSSITSWHFFGDGFGRADLAIYFATSFHKEAAGRCCWVSNRPSISHVYVWLCSQTRICTFVTNSMIFVPDLPGSLSSLSLHFQAFIWCIEQLQPI